MPDVSDMELLRDYDRQSKTLRGCSAVNSPKRQRVVSGMSGIQNG
jgi:hypothetical protein